MWPGISITLLTITPVFLFTTTKTPAELKEPCEKYKSKPCAYKPKLSSCVQSRYVSWTQTTSDLSISNQKSCHLWSSCRPLALIFRNVNIRSLNTMIRVLWFTCQWAFSFLFWISLLKETFPETHEYLAHLVFTRPILTEILYCLYFIQACSPILVSCYFCNKRGIFQQCLHCMWAISKLYHIGHDHLVMHF